MALQRWTIAVCLDCRSPNPLTDPSRADLTSKLIYYFQPNAELFMVAVELRVLFSDCPSSSLIRPPAIQSVELVSALLGEVPNAAL